MALIDGGDRSATVQAKTPMSLLVLSRHDFNEMLSNVMPHVAPKLMQCMGSASASCRSAPATRSPST